MKLTQWFGLAPEDLEGPLDGSGGPGGPTGDTGEPDLAQQPVLARRKRRCPCCHGTGEHPSGFECYRCDAGGSLEGDDPGAGSCDGEGGSMSATAAGHIGEPSYEEDDGYTRNMWDRWHPNLPATIHRALAVKIPADHPANDTGRPMHERAHALLGDLANHLEGRGGLGMHWTSDPGHLRKHLADRIAPGETPVMVHARTPPREHIEDNGWVHEDRAIRDWDTDEREVPVKRNAPLHITGLTWGGNHHDFEEPITKRAERTTVHGRELESPLMRQYGRSVSVDTEGHPNVEMVPTEEVGRYASQPTTGEHAKEVAAHFLEKGSMTPLILQYHPKTSEAYLGEGNHRLRAARTLGITHLPVRVTRNVFGLGGTGVRTPQEHPAIAAKEHVPGDMRPSDLGIGTGLHTTAAVHADDDDGNIHRGLTTVLPPDVHRFVHDPAQPVAARAHMLLAHVRKTKPEINSEEAHGSTGGLGNFWSPIKHKGAEYADQTGFQAYREHEREHHCGGEYDASGGCPTTNVVVHAGEPHEKHQWKEEFRPGEEYRRDISWRLPVRPGAPLHVKGISWREGNDHEPRDYSTSLTERDKRGPYTEHDFPSPVRKRAGWSDNATPSGARGRDAQGHEVEMTPQDGWAHLDGSHGEDDGSTVSDHPVTPYEHVHTWLPQGRYWGPNSSTLDQRLFQGDHLRPEIREDVLGKVNTYLRDGYTDWPTWTKVYFAGSQAAQWLDNDGHGNGDFDVLIGIDWPVFHQLNLKVRGTDEEIARRMTTGMWHSINKDGDYFTLKGGRKVGPFDRTFFVNPRAWDITAIKPYAAYDVTDDRWAVHPLKVPTDWSAHSLPESYWGYAEALEKLIDAIGELPPEERHRQAANLWEDLHSHRSDAFGLGGKGLYDIANVLEKYLDQAPGKPWARLVQWKSESPSGAEPWVPTTARRHTLTTIFTEAEVRHEVRDPQSGADYDGIMIALVPPEAVCESLVVDKGEPAASMHVTLAYLGGKKEYTKEQVEALPDLVKGWAHGREPLKASVGGVGTFVNPDKHVLWAAVDIPHGTVFRDDLVRHLEGHGYNIRHDHGWTPHITLAYRTSHVRFLPKVKPVSWKNGEIWCCIGGRWESFPIGA